MRRCETGPRESVRNMNECITRIELWRPDDANARAGGVARPGNYDYVKTNPDTVRIPAPRCGPLPTKAR
jgi:hypothetical protein